jgi:hypothetical protein
MTTTDERTMTLWSFADQVERGCRYDLRIVHDPYDTLIRIQNEGSDDPIFELDSASARDLAALLLKVADAADAVESAGVLVR